MKMKICNCINGKEIKKTIRCHVCGKLCYYFKVSYDMKDGSFGVYPNQPNSIFWNENYDIEKARCYGCWLTPQIIESKKLRKKRGEK